MASTFYITAGLVAVDSAGSPPAVDNSFYMTAGLVANDYVAAGGSILPLVAFGTLGGNCNPMMG